MSLIASKNITLRRGQNHCLFISLFKIYSRTILKHIEPCISAHVADQMYERFSFAPFGTSVTFV